jgi:putative CocE/NonD family hydrolase
VLVYSTDVLSEKIQLIGPVIFALYASSSAVDTDFTVKLLDVYPDGAAYNVSEGIIRARFRNSLYDEPELLTPGEVYRYDIEMQPTANVFKRGHRIRIHVSSSSWPLWDNNLNTGEKLSEAMHSVVGHQVVYQDAARPSHLRISVVPIDLSE